MFFVVTSMLLQGAMNLSIEVEECGFFEGYTLQRFLIITAFSMVSVFGILANTVSPYLIWLAQLLCLLFFSVASSNPAF